MSKYLMQLKSCCQEVQLAACPISGIQSIINTPVIKNFVYEYPSPFSFHSNAIGIAKMDYKEKSALPRSILAGACLTLMIHHGLVEDKLSSVERNMLLSECTPYTLHSLLHLFLAYSRARIENFPHFSFQSLLDNSASVHTSATIQDTVLAYIKACMEDVEQTAYSPISIKTQKKARKAERNTSAEQRSKIKAYTATLQREGLVNNKVIAILNLVAQKNNLYTLNSSIRNKLVEKLDSLENESAALLADLIKSAKSTEDTDITQHFASPVKRSLADILKAKINGDSNNEEQEDQDSTADDDEEDEEEYEEPVTKDLVDELYEAYEEVEAEQEGEDDDF